MTGRPLFPRESDPHRAFPALGRWAVIFIIPFFVSFLAPESIGASPRYRSGEILVAFKSGTSPEAVRKLHQKMGSVSRKRFSAIGVEKIRIASGLSVEDAVERYRRDPSVLYAEPNYNRRPFVTLPNDPDFIEQWNLSRIRAPEAWDRGTEAPDLVIALIDSGLDRSHPDLDDNVWVNPGEVAGDGEDNDGNGFEDDVTGWNFIGDQFCTLDGAGDCDCPQDDPNVPDDPGNPDTDDDYGHGTHVAGIVAAEGNNATGIAGVLWSTRLMPLKIIDRNGCGSIADEVQAFEYAISQGAGIINASFGGEGRSEAERDAIAAAESAGILVVAAAGNTGTNNDVSPIYPANYGLPNLISVGATDDEDRLADFSNFGPQTVDIAAPGECVLSTTPLGEFALKGAEICAGQSLGSTQAVLSGTSMAAPHVTGAAGLLLALDPTLTPAQTRATLMLTADPLESLSGLVVSGGRLNLESALSEKAGSGLSDGAGGCGGVGLTLNDSTSRGTAAAAVLTLFSPLLIPIGRRLRWAMKKDRPILQERGFRRVTLVLIPFLCLAAAKTAAAESSPDASEAALRHSAAVRLGYHVYPDSEYFQTNEGFFSSEDLAGPGTEIGYRYRFPDPAALHLTVGRNSSRTDSRQICCTKIRMTSTYVLITPAYRVRSGRFFEWYLGGGLGYYFFEREQSGIVEDRLTESVPGIHGVLGMEWFVSKRVSSFLELRYARAVIEEANALGDSLDIGGADVGLGVSYHFHRLL